MRQISYLILILTIIATTTPLHTMNQENNLLNKHASMITIRGKLATLFDHITCALTSNNKEYFGEKIVFYNYTKINNRARRYKKIKTGITGLSEEQLEHIKNGKYLYIPAFTLPFPEGEEAFPLTIVIGTRKQEVAEFFKGWERAFLS